MEMEFILSLIMKFRDHVEEEIYNQTDRPNTIKLVCNEYTVYFRWNWVKMSKI